MAMGLTLSERPYILKCDRDLPAEEQTTFHLRPLKFSERCEIQDQILATEISARGPKDGDQKSLARINTGRANYLMLIHCITKIANFKDAAGTLVEFNGKSTEAQKQAVFDILNGEWTTELADEIRRISGMSREEEKN